MLARSCGSRECATSSAEPLVERVEFPQAGLDAAEREFLLSLARNEPKWDLLGPEQLEQLPGIRWKLENLGRLAKANPKKLKEQAHELERLLGQNPEPVRARKVISAVPGSGQHPSGHQTARQPAPGARGASGGMRPAVAVG